MFLAKCVVCLCAVWSGWIFFWGGAERGLDEFVSGGVGGYVGKAR